MAAEVPPWTQLVSRAGRRSVGSQEMGEEAEQVQLSIAAKVGFRLTLWLELPRAACLQERGADLYKQGAQGRCPLGYHYSLFLDLVLVELGARGLAVTEETIS